ncbi:MAG: hypothetical protein IKP81_07190 [Paludibacteraceae bacterium]|nr:hypothetical protein [Paludibacteraceae bacterium]
MNYKVTIKKIDWLDEEAREAEVCFELGDTLFWAFSYPCPFTEGEKKNVHISFIMDDDIDFDIVFSGNKDKEIKIVNSERSKESYYCYGKVVSINPVIADCGDMFFNLGDLTHDVRVVGEYVYFVIERLDICYAPM